MDKTMYVPMPYVYNMDYQGIADLTGVFNISDCNIWYMFEFDKKVPLEEREFFG